MNNEEIAENIVNEMKKSEIEFYFYGEGGCLDISTEAMKSFLVQVLNGRSVKFIFGSSRIEKGKEVDLNQLINDILPGKHFRARIRNQLAGAGVVCLRDLVAKKEIELWKIPLGRKSINEINEVLRDMGLSLAGWD